MSAVPEPKKITVDEFMQTTEESTLLELLDGETVAELCAFLREVRCLQVLLCGHLLWLWYGTHSNHAPYMRSAIRIDSFPS